MPLKKTKRTVNPIPEVKPLWRVKASFSYHKGSSYLDLDMSDNFETLEAPASLLAEGIWNILAEIKKLMPKTEEAKKEYNELVKDIIKDIEQSLVHYS